MEMSYEKPDLFPPISSSDHNCILWRPKIKQRPPQFTIHLVHPIKKSGLTEFGKWVTKSKVEGMGRATPRIWHRLAFEKLVKLNY